MIHGYPMRYNAGLPLHKKPDLKDSNEGALRIGLFYGMAENRNGRKPEWPKTFTQPVETNPFDDGWSLLGTAGLNLRELDPAFDSWTYGHKQLSRLLSPLRSYSISVKRTSMVAS